MGRKADAGPVHDGVRHSTSHTAIREAGEMWKAYLKEAGGRIMGQYGRLNVSNDPKELAEIARSLYAVAQALHGALESLHWPKWNAANSQFSDERAFEQAARHLRTTYLPGPDAGGELAWQLAFSALTHWKSYRDHPVYGEMGVDLAAYFQAEADATLRVVMQDHLRLMREAAAGD